MLSPLLFLFPSLCLVCLLIPSSSCLCFCLHLHWTGIPPLTMDGACATQGPVPNQPPPPPDPCNIADPGLPKAAVCSRSNCLFENLWCRPSSCPLPLMTSSLLLRPLRLRALVQETAAAAPHAFQPSLSERPAGRTWPAGCISHPRGWVMVLSTILQGVGE